MATYKEDYIALKNIIIYFKFVLPPDYTITHGVPSYTVYHTILFHRPHPTEQHNSISAQIQ